MNKLSFKFLIHFVGWLFFFGLIAAFLQNKNTGETWVQITCSVPFLIFVLFYFILFYLNFFVLMPHIFLKGNYLAFFIAVVGLLTAVFYIKPFDQLIQARLQFASGFKQPTPDINTNNQPPPPPPKMHERAPSPIAKPPAMTHKNEGIRIDIISLILFFMTITGSAMIVLSKQWRIAEKNKALADVQKANAELAFLKAQISPHFLFNVLNNIYALVISRNENAASGILRLSNIMRYVTDEARADFVPVEKEIACINDFIELQKLRLSKTNSLNYSVTGSYSQVTVAPLILLAFVENTFKHGISNNIPSEINIDISVTESAISLKTQNRIVKRNDPENREGVGLQNVIQRLKLLYPNNKHQLHVTTENDFFTVVLSLHNT